MEEFGKVCGEQRALDYRELVPLFSKLHMGGVED